MHKHPALELPIRSKLDMVNDIIQIIQHLHFGNEQQLKNFIEDLKIRSLFLDEQIQRDVLIFSEQIQFQYTYDPYHKVTAEIEMAADKLIEDLGFNLKQIKN